MRQNDLPQRELAEDCGVSLRTVARWAADGRLPRDPVTGRIIRGEAEAAFAPWAREHRLKNIINSLPLGTVALVLVDSLGREQCLQIFRLIDGPGGNGPGDGRS